MRLVLKIEKKIETRTPVWTGDTAKRCGRLRETGLLGSLRWWFEVVVRGLGGCACDPTAKERSGGGQGACPFDADRYEEGRRANKPPLAAAGAAGLCPACQVFGATGWRKLFQLEVANSQLQAVMDGPDMGLLLPSGRAGGWYILPALYGTFTLAFHFRPEMDKPHQQLLLATLRLMEHWAAIGAKETNGYGVFRVTDGPKFELPEENPFPRSQKAPGGGGDTLPSLTDFFFAKIRFRVKQDDWWQKFKEVELATDPTLPCHDHKSRPIKKEHLQRWFKNGTFPLSPIIRNWLRYTWYPKLNFPKSFEYLLFGTVERDRRRAAIGISHAYRVSGNEWEFRIWGHRPSGVDTNNSSAVSENWEKFVAGLWKALRRPEQEGGPSLWDAPKWKRHNDGKWRNENGGLFADVGKSVSFVWREFDSDRDTLGKISDRWEFFKSLVKEEEGKNG